eukprot:m.55963 g.55963  ORF g.55963 m.55963 type:complete len:894 (-) comp16926_c0_seq1:125-2806(-)
MADTPRRLKAVEDYKAQASGELNLKIGDVIFVPKFDEQKGSMLHGVSAGKVGKFPRHVLEDTTVVHTDGNVTPVRAVHDYTAQKPGELTFPHGAKMFVVNRVDDKWWRGVYNNDDGLIPSSHIQADKTRKVEKSDSDPSSPSPTGADTSSAGGAAPQQQQRKSVDGPPVWDWGKLPKERAERELRGEPAGTFLVRASESSANAYSISVVAGKTVRHIRLLSTKKGFSVNAADAPVPTIPGLINKMMGKSLQVRPAGSSGATADTKLLVKPLPRLPSSTPCCWKAKPVDGGGSVSGGGGAGKNGGDGTMGSPSRAKKSVDGGRDSLKDSVSKLPPAPKGPPAKKSAATSSAAPSLQLNEVETRVYHGLWERVVDPGESLVAAGPAASYFQSSGIDNAALGYIWNAADTEKRGLLSESQFAVALKLIALKQSGQPAELSNLQVPSRIPQLSGHTEAVQASLQAATAAPQQSAKPAGTPWVVQDAEFETYRGFFSGVDKDGDGLVNGAEVMGVFLSSKLSKQLLGQIWNLVDISTVHKGLLDVGQFALAMWIIAEQVKGVAVPTTLTPTMMPPSMRDGADSGGASPFVAPVASAAPPPAAATPDFLSIKERAVYSQLWTLAVPAGQDHMGPGEAVTFLQASGLDNGVLGAIWDAADQAPKGQLVKTEFFVALKLIALHQAGGEVSVSNLGTSTPLPMLSPYTMQALAAGLCVTQEQVPTYTALWQKASQTKPTVGTEVVGLFQASGLSNAVLGEIWELSDTPPDKGVLREDEFFVALKLIAICQGGGAVAEAALTTRTGLPQLGETTAQLATRLWGQLGLDATSTADGGSLRPVLMESGVEVAKLGEVWQLADSNSSGSLNFSEFQVLCGLVGQAQRGEGLNRDIISGTDTAAKFP